MKNKKNIDINVFRKLFNFYKIERKKIYILFFIIVMSSLIQSVAPLGIKLLTDIFIINRNLKGFAIASVLFMIAVLLGTYTIYNFYVLGGKFEYEISMQIRKQLFKKIEKFSITTIKNYETAELITRLTSDIQKLSEVFSWSIMDGLYSAIVVIISIIIMLYLSFKLTIMLFIISPIVYIISLFFQKKILKYQRKVRKYNSNIIKSYTESVTYIKTIKALGIENRKIKEFEKYNRAYRKNSLNSIFIASIYVPMIMFIASIAVGFVFNYSAITVMNNVMSYGAFLSFLTYSMQLFEPLRLIAQIFSDLKSAQASAERIVQILSSEDKKKNTTYLSENKEFLCNIKFENVSFHYQDDEKLILKNFNLEIKEGQSVAFIGSTGSGKSTIVNLICKFYKPTSGKIYLNNIEYDNINKEFLYDNLGYVLQKPQLFSISIKENIKFGNENASDMEILQTCKLLGIDEFIKNLPNGIDTIIGENGYNLSNGQKQLISFARALIKKPKLLVLDEATSSIDTETEKIIQSKMKNILKNKTSIIVAHRLSTIRDCDLIVLIENGNIIEKGTHIELLNKKGIYYKMYISEELKI